ncbi:multiple epidermal growth factor-like domains protein 10 [Haliotis rufescens]|uniref:multiple epidermal growth factor-like domains protein 10 n=1 Tax=Haliotis rufescens TaxID=6454 RepID=UPI00201EBF6F|nr:multiple epidermal growth factor-like domains protein 10 [Haliotis rufescens]
MRKSTMVILVKSITWLPFILTVSGVICDNPCDPGLYGKRCDKRCNDNCRSDMNRNIYCEKHSGICLLGCAPGWYNDKCTIPCSKNCIGGVCYQNGQCTYGCKGNYGGALCHEPKVYPPHVPDENNGHIILIVIGVVLCILVVGAAIIKFARPRLSGHCNTNSGESDADADEEEAMSFDGSLQTQLFTIHDSSYRRDLDV